MRSRAEKKLADEKAKEELRARKAARKAASQPTPAQQAEKERKKRAKAEKKAAFKAAEKQKPVYKRRWFIITMAIIAVVVIILIYDAAQPNYRSISAVYTGSTVEGTKVDASDFKVTALLDNGEKETVDKESVTIKNKNDITIYYGNTYEVTLSCQDPHSSEDYTTKVTFKCNKLISYTQDSGSGYAREIAKTEIDARLKAPKTASYHDWGVMKTGHNKFLVTGKVDAENSFGAELTSPFMVTVKLGELDSNTGYPTYTVSDVSID